MRFLLVLKRFDELLVVYLGCGDWFGSALLLFLKKLDVLLFMFFLVFLCSCWFAGFKI